MPGKRDRTVKERVEAVRERLAGRKLDRSRTLFVPGAAKEAGDKTLTVIHGGDSKGQVAEALANEGLFEEAAKYTGRPPATAGDMPKLRDSVRRNAVSLDRPGLKREIYRYEPAAPAKTQQERVNRVVDRFFETGNIPGNVVPERMEGQGPSKSAEVNEAYANTGHVFNFYKSVMGRLSLDGKGMPIRAITNHADVNHNGLLIRMQNAFYESDDNYIRLGESPQRRYTATQTVGHELSHGVTAHTAGLVYKGQSGALNEHFSDVFAMAISQWKDGVTVDKANWNYADDGLKVSAGPGARGPRSMSNPAERGQPGHMNDYIHTKADHGGVHGNSGIPNRAFYVASMAMGGRVWERAAKIWYVTLRDYLDEDADFSKCARATAHVAQQIYGEGSREHLAVKTGWKAVGIEVDDRSPAPIHRSVRPKTDFVQKTVRPTS